MNLFRPSVPTKISKLDSCRSSISRDSPDNLHGVVVLLVVDAHDEHGSVGAGSRDHHPLGSALQVSLQGHKRGFK